MRYIALLEKVVGAFMQGLAPSCNIACVQVLGKREVVIRVTRGNTMRTSRDWCLHVSPHHTRKRAALILADVSCRP